MLRRVSPWRSSAAKTSAHSRLPAAVSDESAPPPRPLATHTHRHADRQIERQTDTHPMNHHHHITTPLETGARSTDETRIPLRPVYPYPRTVSPLIGIFFPRSWDFEDQLESSRQPFSIPFVSFCVTDFGIFSHSRVYVVHFRVMTVRHQYKDLSCNETAISASRLW